jgi:hypothetical protein
MVRSAAECSVGADNSDSMDDQLRNILRFIFPNSGSA